MVASVAPGTGAAASQSGPESGRYLASPSLDGIGLKGDAARPAVSADGRVVAFVSSAPNLVPGDTNESADVFVFDRDTGEVERVSVSSDGEEAQGGVRAEQTLAISADGSVVAFVSSAPNLVPGDISGKQDVFVHERSTGTTERVSVRWDGEDGFDGSLIDGAPLSADGRFVLFASKARLDPFDTDATGWDCYRYDRATREIELIQGEMSYCMPKQISPDGRLSLFYGKVAPYPGRRLFLHDHQTGETEHISVSTSGAVANGISGNEAVMTPDARYVAFSSAATNLVSGDTNERHDVFLRDRVEGVTTRASVSSTGQQGDGYSRLPSRGQKAISADGRFIAFWSDASTLVPEDTNEAYDVFVHDTATGKTERVSLMPDGTQVDDLSRSGPFWSDINLSADGRSVSFIAAHRVVDRPEFSPRYPEENHLERMLLVRDREAGETRRVSAPTGEVLGGDLTPDGRYVAFDTSGVLGPESWGQHNVYLQDLSAPEVGVAQEDPSPPVTQAEATGVESLAVVGGGSTVRVEGEAAFVDAPVVVGEDPEGDALLPDAGLDLTRAVISRPDPFGNEVVLRIEVADMPSVPFPEDVRYQWLFDTSAGPNRKSCFAWAKDDKLTDDLFTGRCSRGPVPGVSPLRAWSPTGALPGEVTAEGVEFRYPVSRLGLAAPVIAGSHMMSYPRDCCGPVGTNLLGDGLSFHRDYEFPMPSVRIGVAPAGTPEAVIQRDIRAHVAPDGAFAAEVSTLDPGEYVVLVEACYGEDNCGTESRTVTIEGG